MEYSNINTTTQKFVLQQFSSTSWPSSDQQNKLLVELQNHLTSMPSRFYIKCDQILQNSNSKYYIYQNKESGAPPSIAILLLQKDSLQIIAISPPFGFHVKDNLILPVKQRALKLDKKFSVAPALYAVCRCAEFLRDFQSKIRVKKRISCFISPQQQNSFYIVEQAKILAISNFVQKFSQRFRMEQHQHYLQFVQKNDTCKKGAELFLKGFVGESVDVKNYHTVETQEFYGHKIFVYTTVQEDSNESDNICDFYSYKNKNVIPSKFQHLMLYYTNGDDIVNDQMINKLFKDTEANIIIVVQECDEQKEDQKYEQMKSADDCSKSQQNVKVFCYYREINQSYIYPPLPETLKNGVVQSEYFFKFLTTKLINCSIASRSASKIKQQIRNHYSMLINSFLNSMSDNQQFNFELFDQEQ